MNKSYMQSMLNQSTGETKAIPRRGRRNVPSSYKNKNQVGNLYSRLMYVK